MKRQILISLISFGCLYSMNVKSQSYYTTNNSETNLASFITVNGQWRSINPSNNTLGSGYYQGINFGFDANNYVSLVNGVGSNDLYFGRWYWSWQGWNKIWHSGNLNNSNIDFLARTINCTNISASGNIGIGVTSPATKLDVRDVNTVFQVRSSLSAIVTGNNNGGAVYFGVDNANSTTTPTAAIESSWGNSLNPQIGIGVIRDGLKANILMDYSNQTWFRNGTKTSMFINSSGYVGIGTNNAVEMLTVGNGGKIRVQSEDNSYSNYIYSSMRSSDVRSGQIFQTNGSMNFGLTGPNVAGGFVFRWLANKNTTSGADIDYFGSTNSSEIMRLTMDGKLGLGTSCPKYTLDVIGTIRAQEVKVDLQGGCDFVFKKNYDLMDLKELELFIEKNQHLPEIEPEKEMVENGLDMKEMQMKLLQKIEELTLYTIEQNKKIESIQEQNKLLKEQIELLKTK